MAYVRNGIYLLTRSGKGVEHYGAGFCGPAAWLVGSLVPVVAHLNPTGVVVDEWDGTWQKTLAQATDESAALARLREVSASGYELLQTNCEHFARYVVTGTKESRQVRGAFLAAGLLAMIVLARDRTQRT